MKAKSRHDAMKDGSHHDANLVVISGIAGWQPAVLPVTTMLA